VAENGHGPAGGGGAAGTALAWAGWWGLSAALWLVLVDNTRSQELLAGAVVACLGATAAVRVRAQRRLVTRPRARWLLSLWKPVVLYLRDLVLVTLALARRKPGRFLAIAFDARDEDPREAARRVLMKSAGSFAPNTYVVGADQDHRLLLVHQLSRRDDPVADADPLGLR
jgi:multisubunit Na+/H+ antiporter MnhE subunit